MIVLVSFIVSCNKEDYTGYSTQTPTNPTITVEGIDANGYTLYESDSVFTFNVVLSEAQIVDIAVYVTQIDGDAVEGTDYSIVNSSDRVFIPAYTTEGTLEIKILSDEDVEDTKTLTLQIGDERTANATITPVTVNFTIKNLTEDMLTSEMSWETDVEEIVGIDDDATDVVDLRMLIIDESGNIVETIDDSSYETYDGWDTLSDGKYYIAADIYSYLDYGDYAADISITITLDFLQVGVFSSSIEIADALSTLSEGCSMYTAYLASVTKSGNSYSIEEDYELKFEFSIDKFVGTMKFVDLDDDSESRFVNLIEDTSVDNGLIADSIWANTSTVYPFKFVLDTSNLTVSWDEQTISDDLWGYGEAVIESGSDEFSPCEGIIYFTTLNVTFSIGTYNLPFQIEVP